MLAPLEEQRPRSASALPLFPAQHRSRPAVWIYRVSARHDPQVHSVRRSRTEILITLLLYPDDQEMAIRLLRRWSGSPWGRSASSSMWIPFHTGTARVSSLRPFDVKTATRARRSA